MNVRYRACTRYRRWFDLVLRKNSVFLLIIALSIGIIECISEKECVDSGSCTGDRNNDFEAHVISINPMKNPRYKNFLHHNRHLLPYLQTWNGVDGKRLTIDVLLRANIIEPGLVQVNEPSHILGSAGVTLSHVKIWKYLLDKGSNDDYILILEDDAMVHPNIAEFATNHKNEILDSDITHCSMNMDSMVATKNVASNHSTISVFDPMNPTEEWIANTFKTMGDTFTMDKLLNGFGMSCYFITTKGAKKLLGTNDGDKLFNPGMKTSIFPLNRKHIFKPNPKHGPRQWPPLNKPLSYVYFNPFHMLIQGQIDLRLNALYDDPEIEFDARVIQPFWGYTTNIDTAFNTIEKEKKLTEPINGNAEPYRYEDVMDMLRGFGEPPRPSLDFAHLL